MNAEAHVIEFPKKRNQKQRKSGLNVNKEGSVRKINGQVYIDFKYLNERVRENSGMSWNEKNAKLVREQLDKIIFAVKEGTFRYAKVFPQSKKADHFTDKETELFLINKTPEQVMFKDYAWPWYDLLKGSGRVTERTLLSYKGFINSYLFPFFGDMSFARFNKSTIDKFIYWSRNQKYRGYTISNESVNKLLTLLKMIVKDAAIEYAWGSTFNPFFWF